MKYAAVKKRLRKKISKGKVMKQKAIATAALLALGTAAQAQVSSSLGSSRVGTGASPGIFSSPAVSGSSSSPTGSTLGTTSPTLGARTGTGLSTSTDPLSRPAQMNGTLGTFGNSDRIDSTVPNATPSLPNITSPTPDIATGSQGNPAGVFRDSPVLSNGITPRTGVGSPDATQGTVDPFGSPALHRSDELNGIGAPATGETGADRRLTPPPDVAPNPRPLGQTLGTDAQLSTSPATVNSVNPDTTTLNRSSLSGGQLNTTGVNTPPRNQPQPFDQALSAKIRAQMSQTPVGAKPAIRINDEAIRDMRITSQNGRVMLEGSVNSQQERDMIEKRAREVQGVAAIDNRLKVRNQNVGAPASSQSGQAQQDQDRVNGQSKQNSSDLNDEHKDVTPDR